jgi:hypothetical protein
MNRGDHKEGFNSMALHIDPAAIVLVKDLAKSVKGSARRRLQAAICDHFGGLSPRKAESLFQWNRKTVARGIEEAQTGREKKVSGKVEADHEPKSNTR